jgi:hypothetical protein
MTDESMPLAHQAIRLLKQGRMQGKEMLSHLVQGKLSVPVAELPEIVDARHLRNWSPATVSKADGSQWLVAYTLEALAHAFAEQHPDYPLVMTVDTTWVLDRLPDSYGIAINFRTEDVMEWNAQGLARFKKDVLGRQ